MNYEELYSDMLVKEKEIKENADGQQKVLKKIVQSIGQGDLKSVPKLISLMRDYSKNQDVALNALSETIDGFDAKEYIDGGDFAVQLLEACNAMNINVSGEFPVYEMFPFRVQINPESMDMTVNRKKVQTLRPRWLIDNIKAELDKLTRVSFNATAFASELVDAYDLSLLRQANGKPYALDADCNLLKIYEFLTPMKRFKKDYDKQSFAFDLARLYAAKDVVLEDGRKFQFGPSRQNAKAIRILDQNGAEQYITTIRFFKI